MPDHDQVAFDKHGFMRDPHIWNTGIAAEIADSIGLKELDSTCIQVVEYLREHYFAHGSVLPEEVVCHALGLEMFCIRKLFGDYEKAWKTAGLPDPGMQLREFMEDES